MSDNWEYKAGTGRWQEYVNPETKESSIKEHTLKTVWESCPPKECCWNLTDSPKRELTCMKCGAKTTFIVGLQKLVDGKLIDVSPKV